MPSGTELTAEQVRRVAGLCKLRLDEAEAADARRRLSAVLGHMACLASLPLDGVEPMARAIDEPARLRGDEPGGCLGVDEIRAMAPRVFDHGGSVFIAVPRVLDDAGGPGRPGGGAETGGGP